LVNPELRSVMRHESHPPVAIAPPASRGPRTVTAHPTITITTARTVAMPARRLQRLSPRARLLVLAPLCCALIAAIGLAGLLVSYTLSHPNPMSLRKQAAVPVVRVLDRNGVLMLERGDVHDYLPYDMIPAHVIEAVVATEDRRFFEHIGIDPAGLARAAFANLRARRFVQGGSTLTQQLAKNLFLSSDRRLARKIEEMALALWLEVRLSKKDILELYLNRVYFGGGAYGLEAAAHRYFGKSARDLTLAEAAVIAGVLKAPSKFAPTASPALARARARSVIAKMTAARFITAETEQRVLRQAIKFADTKHAKESSGLEYAVDAILERLPQLSASEQRDIVIETTIDAGLQKHAQASAQAIMAAEGEAAEAGQAGLVVLDMEGGIRALVGGRSYAESQFNRAVKSRRQPGSAFKPFVYLAALESGLSPDSMAFDLPVVVDGWSPRNEGGQYRGAVTLRQALAQSINTVAVRLHIDIGPQQTIAAARRLGIAAPLREGPALALGASEVSLLELTGAYGAFASGGHRLEPHLITRVRDGNGRALYQRPATASAAVIAPQHLGAMNDMLNAALVSGTGRRAGLPRHPAAGKTGTTQDFRDAWFVGYTAHLAGGVWIGNDNGKAMNRVMGGNLPARLWREVMQQAHAGLEPKPLPGTAEKPVRPPPAMVEAPAPSAPPMAQAAANAPKPERIGAEFFTRALKSVAPKPQIAVARAQPAPPAPGPPAGPVAGAAPRAFPGFVSEGLKASLAEHAGAERPSGIMGLGAGR
jgi:penicillin-binding protein 1A